MTSQFSFIIFSSYIAVCFTVFAAFTSAQDYPQAFLNAPYPDIKADITVQVMGQTIGQIDLRPEFYIIDVQDAKQVYTVIADGEVYGVKKQVTFAAYDPDREKGRTYILWEADEDGFYISYDKQNWTLGAPWK